MEEGLSINTQEFAIRFKEIVRKIVLEVLSENTNANIEINVAIPDTVDASGLIRNFKQMAQS